MTRIGGAMLITFYRGVKVKMLSFHINLFNQRNGGGAVHSSHSGGRLFLVGAMLAFFNNASYALWPIIQAKVSRAYLYPLFKHCTHGFQSVEVGLECQVTLVAYAVCYLDHFSLAIMYSSSRCIIGIVVSGVMVAVISWCVRMRGPLFFSVFSPLMLVVLFLDPPFLMGSYILEATGTLPQNLHIEALALTSVTFAAAISNLIPAITFILSLSFCN
ncbi:hypothetical protein Ahy_A04g017409 isoform B [Arachis hypogaea]|uniref:Uncharacterized protein n=1 Tax=Arachis hypogaea TaxID=3818 RepID=A0A445DAU6_ARAHY|nr:hypothetical protein Ahy_A04g017409 isoform B [Arachis hypogaea]